jgi:drug/metabolite transporter (DMT)-like permease
MYDLFAQMDFLALFQMIDFNAWDLEQFFKNGQNIGKAIGGAFLGLIGVIAVIAGGTYLGVVAFKKQQRGTYVVHAVIALIIGGALAFGGYSLFDSMAQGGYDKTEELGK